jgi:hypothetical protein
MPHGPQLSTQRLRRSAFADRNEHARPRDRRIISSHLAEAVGSFAYCSSRLGLFCMNRIAPSLIERCCDLPEGRGNEAMNATLSRNG